MELVTKTTTTVVGARFTANELHILKSMARFVYDQTAPMDATKLIYGTMSCDIHSLAKQIMELDLHERSTE